MTIQLAKVCKQQILTTCTCTKLIDINECLLPDHGCEQICENTNGSYICSCYGGYNQTGFRTCNGQFFSDNRIIIFLN